MIVIGYQGIGKSTLSKSYLSCIDLENGNFWFESDGKMKRHDNWYISYANIAEHLSQQGYTVFVSSHKEVREQLKNSTEKVVVCCPSLDLEEPWIEKLRKRFENFGLEKDYKAYMNAKDRYKENIEDIINSGFEVRLITSMDYILEDLLDIKLI